MKHHRGKTVTRSAKEVDMNENVDKLIEEMAELTFALLKLRKSPTSAKWKKEVQGELADVKVSLDININIFGKKKVESNHKTRLSKVRKRL